MPKIGGPKNDRNEDSTSEVSEKLAFESSALLNAEMWALRFEAICEATSDFVGITSVDGSFFYLNPAARSALGIEADEDVTQLDSVNFFDLEFYSQVSDAIIESLIATGSWSGELRLKHRSGRTFPVSQVTTVHTLEDGSPSFFSSISRDISNTKALEETLQHQATHDRLTNLPNHSLFQTLVIHAISRNTRNGLATAIAFVDLDRFKSINDGFGHIGGDEALMEVAHRLTRAVRPGDTVGRFGGDEFIVLIEDLPPGDAEEIALQVAIRITDALRVNIPLSSSRSAAPATANLSASVGVAVAGPNSGISGDSLIHQADLAMYEAKAEGKDRVAFFDDALRITTDHAIESAGALSDALLQKQFEVEFQPMVDMRTGSIYSAEALVRWRRPDGRVMQPAEFISIAEEHGFISSIGAYVIEEAARCGVKWRESIPYFIVSVNVSATQLLSPGFLNFVSKALSESGLEPNGLSIEITEYVVLKDVKAAVEVLQGLRALGVWIAIDDFGTGYSSLSYLRDLPVNAVKIDRAFVETIVESERDRGLLATIILMADALDLFCVAEGVETEAQRDLLLGLGVVFAQGFLFSRSVSPEKITELVADAVTKTSR
ncbi:MAG: EAL domain-containing protein [Acidimicrobiia bacterium]|nr:EAL domain-containing protein [Acidimicrobiia bacterium]